MLIIIGLLDFGTESKWTQIREQPEINDRDGALKMDQVEIVLLR